MIALLKKLWTTLSRLGGRAIDVSTTSYERRAQSIQRQVDGLLQLPTAELTRLSCELRQRVQRGATPETVQAELFALACAAAQQTLGMRPFDVQLIAALAINDGKIAEMQTGEGKTLAAVLPACLRAFTGRGVHVLTFNDYLASRDAEWMGPIYRALGLSVGCVVSHMTPAQRREAYGRDVTYSTAKEVGFDFLRDQLVRDSSQLVQRGHHFAIIDEADSLLIDQGRIPLVIATHSEDDAADLYRYAELTRTMRPHRDYHVDDAWRNVSYNMSAIDRIERDLRCGELHSVEQANLLARLNLALHAQVLMRRDVDYIVRDGKIELIDELTGRVVENRRWPWGLQAAVEAKERIDIQPQGKILNSITLQHFFNLYDKIGGMTATAQNAADEFLEFYSTKIVVIPPNRTSRRIDRPDRIFPTRHRKFDAVVEEIAREHRRGRPVLVGTDSVAESERLSERLARMRISHHVLNAKNDHAEADLVAEAGAIDAVTISTNMAGRGTDIRLGGSREADRERVIQLGGLYVIGTCRNESRRIDNQLRGRAGRQGDPGESRFFVSLQDDLLTRHGIGQNTSIRLQNDAGTTFDDDQAVDQIAHIQRVIEGENLEIHRTLRKYSHLIELQRRQVQQMRTELLNRHGSIQGLNVEEPDLYQELVNRFGRETIEKFERRFWLQAIDECWSDYLERVAEIREGIHLQSMGGLNPMDAFNNEVTRNYRGFVARVSQKATLATKLFFINRHTTPTDADLAAGSSATWTYMINDNPMGDFFERIRRSVERKMLG